jgi:hypothetical protein
VDFTRPGKRDVGVSTYYGRRSESDGSFEVGSRLRERMVALAPRLLRSPERPAAELARSDPLPHVRLRQVVGPGNGTRDPPSSSRESRTLLTHRAAALEVKSDASYVLAQIVFGREPPQIIFFFGEPQRADTGKAAIGGSVERVWRSRHIRHVDANRCPTPFPRAFHT